MSQRSLAPLGILAITLATACTRAAAPVQPDTIIALERGALDRWGRGDPQGYLDLYAREVTYFDPMREKRIDGLDAMQQAFEPIKGLVKVDRYEMIDPQVHRAGDAAILTYNLVSYGRSPAGEAIGRAVELDGRLCADRPAMENRPQPLVVHEAGARGSGWALGNSPHLKRMT